MGPSLNTKDSLLGSEPNSLGMNPCLDILLSENVLSHVLAASRDELTLRNCTYIFENIVFMEFKKIVMSFYKCHQMTKIAKPCILYVNNILKFENIVSQFLY